MIQILEIETITKDHNEVYCVAYSREVADMIHYTNIDLAQLLHYINTSRNVIRTNVVTDESTEHILNYLERNHEMLITEMIINSK